MELFFNDSWDQILACWDAAPRHVAVAYFSCDDGLDFSPDDVLVVDASDKAIMTGQTDAQALSRASATGAVVYHHPDLHTKIYALGPQVFVGSANASAYSRTTLIECVARSADPFTVSAARKFIIGLANDADEIDSRFLKRILALPVNRTQRAGRKMRKPVVESRARCWLLGMHEIDPPSDVEQIERDSDEYDATLPASEVADWFWWPAENNNFFKHASENDVFVQIWRKNRSVTDAAKVRVQPPATIDRITIGAQDRRRAYHFSTRDCDEDRSITWRQFLRLLSQVGWTPDISYGTAREIPERFAREIGRLWPK